jgi:hypothetical protein
VTTTLTVPGFDSLSEIGRGGFGVVYRARQTTLRRWEAVKVLPGVNGDSEAFTRFTRECQALGAVGNHPNIATLYASGLTEDGAGYLSLELLDGGSLGQRCEAGPLPWQEVVEIGVALCGALESAHRAGVLHRDIKPENIMFDGLGTPKLLDFGIATVPGALVSRSTQASLTFAHAAPEVVAGARGTVSSDIYSLASSLYTALRGRPPFARDGEETLIPLLARIAAAPVPDLREHGISDKLCAVLERALSKDPAARPASAEELGVDLAQVLVAHGGRALTPPVLTPVGDGPAAAYAPPGRVPEATVVGRAERDRAGGRRRWLALACVLALLVAGGAGYLLSRAQTGAVSAGSVLGDPPTPAASPAGTVTKGAAPKTAGLAVPGAGASASSPASGSASTAGTESAVSDGGSTGTATAGTSPRSTPAAPSTPVTGTVPAAPTAGAATVTSRGSGIDPRVGVLLSWSPASGGGAVTGYQVRRTLLDHGQVAGVLTRAGTGRTLSWSVPWVPAGQWYGWQVRAVGPGGASAWSAIPAYVPRLVGERVDVAAEQLRALGLRPVLKLTGPAPSPAGAGRVWAQSIPAGTVSGATTVTLRYYRSGA